MNLIRSPRKKRSIGTLPDGNHAYLQSLRKFVEWIGNNENITRQNFISWLQEHRQINEKSAANYWQVIVKLGFVSETPYHVSLSDFAREFLISNELQQAELIFGRLHNDFEGIAEIVAVYLEYPDKPFHLKDVAAKLQDKGIILSPTAIEQAIHWLASVGYIEELMPRTYLLSKFGLKLSNKYVTVNREKTGKAYGNYLIQELMAAARYSKQYERLEIMLEETFRFFGYHAKKISGGGNTDVVAEARVLDHQYSSILDGKSRKKGKVTDVNLDRILDHKSKHQTDYAVVIAEDFSDGSLIRNAEARGVTLMTVALLCKWIELHCSTPLNLIDYQAFFTSPGLMNEIPLAVQQKISEIKKQRTILRKLALIIYEQNRDKLYIEQSPDTLRTAISVTNRELLDRNVILNAMELLYHPVVNAAYRDENDGMYLAMSLPTLALALRGLADELDGEM